MHRDALEEIYARLIARSYHDILFTDLQNVQESGWGFSANCPLHEDDAASFSYAVDKPLWFCSGGCGGGDWISYLMKKEEISFEDAMTRLAQEANVDLEEFSQGEWKEKSEMRNLMEDSHVFFCEQLFEERGETALRFLKERGYSLDEIKAMGLGFYPSSEELDNYLMEKGHELSQFEESGLKAKGLGTTHVISIPYNDTLGRLKGFIFRTVSDSDTSLFKYEFSSGVETDILFNLHVAQGRETLVIVEDYLDALIAEKREIPGVVATGSSILTRGQLETAAKLGARYIILALDNDEEGRDGVEVGLNLLSRRGVKGFVAEIPIEYRTLSELIASKKVNGTDVLKTAIEKAKSGAAWRAGRILKKYDTATDRGRQQAFDEALTFEETLKDPVESREFLEALTSGLGITSELLEPWVKDMRRRKLEKHIRNGFRVLFREGEKIVSDSPLPTLQEYLEETARDLRIAYNEAKLKPQPPLHEYLKDKFDREKDRGTGLLGYQLIKFKRLAEKIDGVQPGLYVTAAAPNSGKTALLTNLFLDIISSNSRTKGIYFSLDETRDTIINRFLGIMTEVPLNRIQRRQESGAERNKIKAAYGHLIYLARNGRLIVKDLSEVSHIDVLELEIRERAEENLFICIDGLSNLNTRKYYGGYMEESIDRVSRLKVLADTYRIPVITSSESSSFLNKFATNRQCLPEDIREAERYAYNASIIWSLFAENEKTYKETDEPVIVMEFEKNKLSPYKGTHKFLFKKHCGLVLEEKEGGGW